MPLPEMRTDSLKFWSNVQWRDTLLQIARVQEDCKVDGGLLTAGRQRAVLRTDTPVGYRRRTRPAAALRSCAARPADWIAENWTPN